MLALPPNFTYHEWTSDMIPSADFEACYRLVRRLKPLYESSGYGWDSAQKRQEMLKDNLLYLVVYDHKQKLSAFLSLVPSDQEFLDDDEIPAGQNNSTVTYIYELHSKATGLGLGRFLVEKAKERARATPQVTKIMLTVFAANIRAQNFYLWSGFSLYKNDAHKVEEAKRETLQREPRSQRQQQKRDWHPDLILQNAPSNLRGWFQMVCEV